MTEHGTSSARKTAMKRISLILLAFAVMPVAVMPFLVMPVNRGPVLRVKELTIEGHICAHLGIGFSSYCLAVDHEDYLRRHPTAAKFLILVELRLRRLRALFAYGANHADEVEIVFVDPELRQMQVSLPGAHP